MVLTYSRIFSSSRPFLSPWRGRASGEQAQEQPARRIFRNTLWNLLGTVFGRFSALLVGVICARLLGKVAFGEFTMVQSSANMFAVFAASGLGLTNTRFIGQLSGRDPERVARIILLSERVALLTGVLAFAGIGFGGPWLAQRALGAPHLAVDLQISGAFLLFSALHGAQTGALAGFEAFRRLAAVNIIQGLAAVAITSACVWQWHVRGAVLAWISTIAISYLVSRTALSRLCPSPSTRTPFKAILGEWRVLLNFSLPAVISGAMITPVVWLSNAMLVNQPDGFSQLGLFNAANNWRMPLLFIPGIVGQAVLPTLSSAYGRKDMRYCRKALFTGLGASLLPALLVGLSMILLRKRIMGLYGAEYSDATQVFTIVVLTGVLLAPQIAVSTALTATGKMWLSTWMNLGWACVLLTATWFMVSQGLGALGLAVAHLTAYAAHACWTFAFAFRLIKSRAELDFCEE